MAIDSIGAMLSLGTPQAAGMVDQTAKTDSAADTAKARADAAAARQTQELADVRQKGIYAWAQEKKLEALKEKIEQQMKTEAGEGEIVAGSDPATWSKDETSFEAEVARRMEKMLEDAMKSESSKAESEGRNPNAMIIDISV